jgi:pSer/pThr/pTyr-binding forkhead associated (FHA) protein
MDEDRNEEQVTTEEAHEGADHPMTAVAAEGWSSPQSGDQCARLAKLVLKRSNAETDVEYPVNPPAIVGRFDPAVGPIDVDLGSIPEGSYVSRRHAKVSCDDGVWRIEDLGSSNGTFVLSGSDFERVEIADLEDGQEIAFGNARFVFRVTASEEVAAADNV